MKKMLGVLLIFFVIQSAYAANLPDFPFVVAVGNAEREVKPDEAVLRMGVMAFEKEPELALKKVNLATTAVSKIIQKYGIKINQLEATDISKSTKRKRGKDYNRLEILGYEVSRSISLELNDLSNYSNLISDLVALRHVSGLRTVFDVTNREHIEAELVIMASRDARAKADSMAKSLGTKIQSVYAISQASNFGDFFATFGAISYEGFADMAYASDSDQFVTFMPESISISQNINVVFEIK